jgi:hypothetical protein
MKEVNRKCFANFWQLKWVNSNGNLNESFWTFSKIEIWKLVKDVDQINLNSRFEIFLKIIQRFNSRSTEIRWNEFEFWLRIWIQTKRSLTSFWTSELDLVQEKDYACNAILAKFRNSNFRVLHLAWLPSWWSKPPDVDVCPRTVFIWSSVLTCKPTNILPHGFEAQTKKSSWWFCASNHQTTDLGFEAQTSKPSQWFWGQTTDKMSPSVLRLNRKTHTSHLHHVYDVDRIRHQPASRSSGHRVPDLCLIIPNPPHQISYSWLDPCHCPPCCIHHLHIMRQANTFLHTE